MSQDRPIPTERLRTLHDQLVERFTLDELRDLSFGLGVRWEGLAGDTIDAKATSLLEHLNHRLQIPELIDRLHMLRPGIAWALDDLVEAAEPPYRGLDFYREEDAPLFFGRARLTAELVERLCTHPFLAVVGASGSGKSSVVRAGVIPALKADTGLPEGSRAPEGSREWAYLTITPTESPLERLALALTSDLVTAGETRAIIRDLGEDPASLRLYVRKYLERQDRPRLCLLVDQLEELFTACKDETQRRAFIDGLLSVVDSGGPAMLVITLRADFYHHCAQYDGLRHAVEQRQTYIGAPSADELRQAIIEPARRRGYDLEPGLAELMLRDVGDEPGGLPLLSHALLETWARRDGQTLTLAGYNEAGGVRGAIARTAERVYGEMDEGQRETARHIFVELAELGEGTEDTRRRLRLDELAGHGWYDREGATVLEGLVRARLTTADDQTIQIAHEALIREWPRLREWLDVDRVGERLRRGVQNAAREWDEHGREPSYLFDGARLVTAREWIAANPGRLDERGASFMDAGLAEAEREAREKEAARQRELEQAQALAAAERRRARVIRWAAAALGLLALLALVAAWFAVTQRDEARQQAARASSRALSFAAREVANDNPTLALLLTAEAGKTSDTSEAFNTLRPALTAPGIEMLALEHDGPVTLATWNDDESRILTAGEDGAARVWDAATGVELLALPHDGPVTQATWNGDESRILTAGGDGTARVWDAATGVELPALPHDGPVTQATWNGDESRILTAGNDGAARVWDAATGVELLALPHGAWVTQATWNGDESRILTAGFDGAARVWDAVTGEELLTLPHGAWVTQATWNGDESRILTASGFYEWARVRVWDAATGEELLALPHGAWVTQATWNGDESRILTAGDDGTARVSDAATGEELLALPRGGWVNQATWNGDESRILTAGSDGAARVWDAATGEELLALPHDGPVSQATWNGDESRILTAGSDGAARVWDAATGVELLALPHGAGWVTQATWNGDGSRILTAGFDGTARVWDAVTGEELLTLPHGAWVTQATWNGDESRILTASEDAAARVWDAATGVELLALPHGARVTQATWNGNESRILTAGEDNTARVWDAATGEEVFRLTGDGTDVLDARWNADESRILIATRGGQVSIHYTRMDDLIDVACARLRRNMTWTDWGQYFPGQPYRQTCPNLPVHYTVPEEARP